MATYARDYKLTVYESVAIEAESKEEAEKIFKQLESGDTAWFYLKNEVFDSMYANVASNVRDMVWDIKTEGSVYDCPEGEGCEVDYDRYL